MAKDKENAWQIPGNISEVKTRKHTSPAYGDLFTPPDQVSNNFTRIPRIPLEKRQVAQRERPWSDDMGRPVKKPRTASSEVGTCPPLRVNI